MDIFLYVLKAVNLSNKYLFIYLFLFVTDEKNGSSPLAQVEKLGG